MDLDILWLLAMPTMVTLLVIWFSTEQFLLKSVFLTIIGVIAAWFHWFDPWFLFLFTFLSVGFGATIVDRYVPENR